MTCTTTQDTTPDRADGNRWRATTTDDDDERDGGAESELVAVQHNRLCDLRQQLAATNATETSWHTPQRYGSGDERWCASG